VSAHVELGLFISHYPFTTTLLGVCYIILATALAGCWSLNVIWNH